ncbi:MAG TPA: protein-disulfide reductase DsbD family protein [Phycisphaerae bacterium]|nr:protein-disulfide reductase DsbD family protein [Phycisphaerae bacterium]HRW53906.1 protein-disulfide reductase DsbD family protein [Phycisphaerae bacterium]
MNRVFPASGTPGAVFAMTGAVALSVLMSPTRLSFGQVDPPEAQPSGNDFVKVRLALEKTALANRGDTNLAVIFDISPGWHLYWRNPGDSGLPPRVTFTPIEGVTFGDPQWPAPKRLVEGETLVDYIHERELVLIIPVTLDDRYKGGDSLPIAAKLDWLVCRERCLQGSQNITTSFPIDDSAKPSTDAKRFGAARARRPRPVKDSDHVTVRWNGPELSVRAAGATSVAFFPYENDESVYPADMVRNGAAGSDTLRLPYDKDVARLRRVAGVLSITRKGVETFVEISIAPAKPS